MNHTQQSKFDEIKHNIETNIQSYTNKLDAVNRLTFYPKKNGEEKANFALNFGLDVGEKYEIRWSESNHEERRYVTIEPKRNPYKNNRIESVEFKIARIYDHDQEKVILPFTEHYIYYSCKEFSAGLEDANQNAKGVFNIIKTTYKEELETNLKLEKYKLEKLPENFEKLCKAANEFHKAHIALRDFGFYSQQIEGRDFYNFLDNPFD